MKYLLSILLFFSFQLLFSYKVPEYKKKSSLKPEPRVTEKTYTNPLKTIDGKEIYIADPFVYECKGTYYLTGTTNLPDGEGFAYYVSTDLITWEYKGALYRKPDNHIGTTAFWAPEVKYYKGKFYMTYSCYVPSHNQALTCLAVSKKPDGPFIDLYMPWFDLGYSAIDADIFVDDDGTPIVYFSKNETRDNIGTGELYVAKLKKDLSGLDGDPVFISRASQPWEKVNWDKNRCNEGPFVFKRKDTYYMTYSANDTGYEFYGVGVSTAKSPLGPWVKDENNPLMTSDLAKGISSPGHNSIVKAPDGELYIVYHRHADANCKKPNWDRVVCIDRLYFDKEGNLKVDSPSSMPQEISW
jgi:beta-xylosidase